ncbi:MAG TPA: hypothetical protein VGD14_09415 [bacterium]
MKKSYKEKLLDPRWQKKRLEILERDNWSCQACGAKDRPLQIHHLSYQNLEPWEIESDQLITLCDVHHKIETNKSIDAPVGLLIKNGFLFTDMGWILLKIALHFDRKEAREAREAIDNLIKNRKVRFKS